jgi:hypothetical protein
MKVLKATQEQKEIIEGVYSYGCEIKFILDLNNNWIVGTTVLTDNNFESIRNKLLELEQIDFQPCPN